MLEQALINVKKYIPSYWPLQSFIANNPLFELNELNFLHALESLSKHVDVKGALSLKEYHDYYAIGKISQNSLKYSITEYLQDNNLSVEESQTKLLNTLTSIEFQRHLEDINDILYRDNILLSNIIEEKSDYIESKKINVVISKFISDFMDLGQAKWKMPLTSNNLYQAWVEYNLNVGNKFIKSIIKTLPRDNSKLALDELIKQLTIPEDLIEKYLIQISYKIIGWMSLIKWLEDRPDNPYLKKSAYITDIYAIWLISEFALMLKSKKSPCYITITTNNSSSQLSKVLESFGLSENLVRQTSDYAIRLIWQRAFEREYQIQLINKIKFNTTKEERIVTKNAQFVFCIDTRSEGMRRKLEFVGNYETFGFAGFFGIGFRLDDENTHCSSLQCPVIVKPENTLLNKNNVNNKTFKNIVYTLFDKSKSGFLSPLIIFDVIGLYFAIALFIKTLIPQNFRNMFTKKTKPTYSNKSINVFEPNSGFKKDEVADKIAFVLKAIGLTTNFSPFVIIVGHMAESENNPFNSSLDCGACGGNGGIPNAIAFCQAANNNDVRLILNQKYNICIPDNTFFVSACHNTTTDEFNYYNLDEINHNTSLAFAKVVNDAEKAAVLLRAERLLILSGDKNLDARKSNWAELIPEMALANNAAFIIGPRWLTQNINLDRRTFLQSYEPDLDENGDILNFIFNAPVLVGHWINSQYYFSTTDQKLFGAGNKAIHNVISRLGVMEGNFSDYKIGLPQQSVMFKDKLLHEPLRLTVLVYAKKDLVENIINNSKLLKNLFYGRWMHLEIIDAN